MTFGRKNSVRNKQGKSMAAPTVLYVGTEQGVTVLTSGDGRKWEVESTSLEDWAVTRVALDEACRRHQPQ